MTGEDVDEDEQYCDNDTLMTCILLNTTPNRKPGRSQCNTSYTYVFRWDPTLQKNLLQIQFLRTKNKDTNNTHE